MKNFSFSLMMLLALTLGLISCISEDDGDTNPRPEPGGATASLSGEITGSKRLNADTIYILQGRVTVVDGATLEIPSGTILKGATGSGANASSLLIAQGAKLFATGTADRPIIMTSISDEIVQGQIESPNLLPTTNNLWGGLLILGKAPISADNVPQQIEGIPPSDTNGQYGGTDPADNSGIINYISVRHGGANIGEGNEINGLTLGGVGTGTDIRYVEVVGNQDDGIECFGGTVNITNALVWAQGDDAFDMDQGYSGTVDNFIYIGSADSDHGMELDGPEGDIPSNLPATFTLTNGSLKGFTPSDKGEYADLRDDVRCTINNVFFFNFTDKADFELDNNGVAQNYLDELINLSNLQFSVAHKGEEGNKTIETIIVEKTGENEEPLGVFETRPLPTSVEVTETATVGADKTKFTFTWAIVAGELDDF